MSSLSGTLKHLRDSYQHHVIRLQISAQSYHHLNTDYDIISWSLKLRLITEHSHYEIISDNQAPCGNIRTFTVQCAIMHQAPVICISGCVTWLICKSVPAQAVCHDQRRG